MLDRSSEKPSPKSSPEEMFPRLHGSSVPPEAKGVRLTLDKIVVSGNTVFSDEELLAPYEHLLGTEVEAVAIFAISQDLTRKYAEAGYPLSRVIVTQQEVEQDCACVKLTVIEGYIDSISVEGEIDGYFGLKRRLDVAVERIRKNRPTKGDYVVNQMLLLQDLHGVTVSSTLSASKTNPGATHMVIRVSPQRLSGAIGFDNRGTDSAGPVQFYTSLGLNGVTGAGSLDEVMFRQADDRQEYENIRYRHEQKFDNGMSVYGSFAHGLSEKPDDQFSEDFDYHSHSNTLQLGTSYPMIRQRERNLSFSFDFDSRESTSYILSNTNSVDRVRAVTGGINFDMVDSFSGVSQFLVSASHGLNALGATHKSDGSSRSNVRADFFKMSGYFSRTQNLPKSFSLYAATEMQWCDTPLYSSEEFAVGGAGIGRGYTAGFISGESGVSAIGEVRKSFWFDDSLSMQLYSFADWGWVHNVMPTGGTGMEEDVSSIGSGVRVYPQIPKMLGQDRLSFDLQWARPVTPVVGAFMADYIFIKAGYSF